MLNTRLKGVTIQLERIQWILCTSSCSSNIINLNRRQLMNYMIQVYLMTKRQKRNEKIIYSYIKKNVQNTQI